MGNLAIAALNAVAAFSLYQADELFSLLFVANVVAAIVNVLVWRFAR